MKILFFLLFSFSLCANDFLLEEVLRESATNSHQKELVEKYFVKMEQKREEERALFFESSKVSRGGKMIYNESYKKKFLELAKK